MRRVWLAEADAKGPIFQIEDEVFHHAVQVLKFRLNEEFEIVFGGSNALRVRLTSIQKKSATVEVLGTRPLSQPARPYVNLALAITKWPVFEEILEKGVELGVNEVQPLITDFSFIRAKNDWPAARSERLQKIIRGATTQSGRGPLMSLREPVSLRELAQDLNRKPATRGLFAYEGQSAHDVRTALRQIKDNPLADIWAIVGSEGGFSESEVAYMQDSGFSPVTLGSQILRVETACLALVSVIKYEFELMR